MQLQLVSKLGPFISENYSSDIVKKKYNAANCDWPISEHHADDLVMQGELWNNKCLNQGIVIFHFLIEEIQQIRSIDMYRFSFNFS